MPQRLMRIQGFKPYLSVVLLNAILDLGHKIIIQNTVFKCYGGTTQIILTALVNACILLPFILFFTPAGFLADRFSKHAIIRWTATLTIPITALVYLSYLWGKFEISFGLTLLLAAQSAFYSPAKYGYIKELTGAKNLGLANGVVQAVTIVAILLGGVIFSLVFEVLLGPALTRQEILQAIAPCGLLLFGGSILETWIAWRIPARKAGDPNLRLDGCSYLRAQYLRQNINKLRNSQTIWLSVLGLSMFWAVNQVLFATFGAHLKDMAGVTSTVVAQGLLAFGGVGIMLGSVTAGRLSRITIERGLIPLGALGMTLCLSLIPVLSHTLTLGLLLSIYGFFGGIFVVPLNALIQLHAQESELGTILAGNNFIQNVGMLLFLLLTVLAALQGLGSIPIISILAAILALGFFAALFQEPQAFLRIVLRTVFAQRYRLLVSGVEHIPAQGGVLLLGNHASWIDWAVLYLALPRPVRFVIAKKYYDLWYLRWFLNLYHAIPISTAASNKALKAIVQSLRDGHCVALFPEGAISRNGQLGTFRRGYTVVATQAGCPIIPFYLRGVWGSSWSRASRYFQKNSSQAWGRDLSVCFGPPLPPQAAPLEVKAAVHRLSVLAWQELAASQVLVSEAWLRGVRRSPGRLAVADARNFKYTRAEALLASFPLARSLRRSSNPTVGILIPISTAAVVANLAALLAGKTVVNLDPEAPEEQLLDCVRQADISIILTTSQKNLPEFLLNACTPIIVETRPLTLVSRVAMYVLLFLAPLPLLRRLFCSAISPDQPATIVFTDRGGAKLTGVCLSHAGIISNARQVASLFPPKNNDTLLTALPPHLSQGLTLGLFWPLLEGIPLVCLPDPSQVRTWGRLCVDFQATIFCATPAMLETCTRATSLHPLMLASLHLVLCTGRPLSAASNTAFQQKFCLTVYQGYGTTETTPVATVNAPDALNPVDLSVQQGRKSGTAGLPLPGAALRIVHPRTLEELPQGQTGLIVIGGTQLMLGYLNDPSGTAKSLIEQDQIHWFVTRDFGCLDEDGFLILENRPI